MMKKNLLRLVSTVENGVSGTDSESMDLIYTYLLQEFGLKYYNHIQVYQVDENLDNIYIEGKRINVDIVYKIKGDFKKKNYRERNLIRLEIIDKGLLMIAQKENKLDIEKLSLIKKKILESDFNFRIPFKAFTCPYKRLLKAILIIHPLGDRFDFYCRIEENKMLICETLIYSGMPSTAYIDMLFLNGRWINDEKIIIIGMNEEVEFHVSKSECKVEVVKMILKEGRLPVFELLRTGSDKVRAWENALTSLPPDDNLRNE